MTDLAALTRAALADLGAGPGVLADWLDERADARGVLLRRRWKRWQADREFSSQVDAEWPLGPLCVDQDDLDFRKYIRRRFRDALAIERT